MVAETYGMMAGCRQHHLRYRYAHLRGMIQEEAPSTCGLRYT
jgi:hypothetical protein